MNDAEVDRFIERIQQMDENEVFEFGQMLDWLSSENKNTRESAMRCVREYLIPPQGKLVPFDLSE